MASRVGRRAALIGVPPLALALAASLGWRARPLALMVVHALALPAIILCAALLATLAGMSVLVSRLDGGEQSLEEEEPLLRPIRFHLATRERPVVGVIGLEPGSGARTIAYNLTTLLGVEGRVRAGGGSTRPLPVCLLSEGPLPTRLGLSPVPLGDYLRRHPGDLGAEFDTLATSLGAWIHGTCLPSQRIGRGQLSRMIARLRRRYDAVIVECGAEDRFLAAAIADEADLLILCTQAPLGGTQAETSTTAAGLLLGRESKTVLVTNRLTAASRRDAFPEFAYSVELPDDHVVQSLDGAGKPWVLRPESAAADQLRALARRVLPRVFPEELANAA